MKQKQFIRNAAFYMALAIPFALIIAGTGCVQQEAAVTSTGMTDKPEAPTQTEDIWAFLPDVVATVGDKKITKEEFVKEALKVLRIPPGQSIPSEYLKQMTPKIAQEMVDKEILLMLAEKAGVKPSSEMVFVEFDAMYASMPVKDKGIFDARLKEQGSSFEQYKKKIGNDPNAQQGIAIDKYLKNNILDKISVSDSDIENFYKEKSEMFKTPETVTASHILIKPENESAEAKAEAKIKAGKILAQVRKAPETFGAVAKTKSACPSGKDKGNLGPFGRGQMVPEFDKVVFTLEQDKISDLVETQFGYHIIKVTDKKTAKPVPLEEVKSYIKQQLTNQKAQKAVKEVLDKEKEKLDVKINL